MFEITREPRVIPHGYESLGSYIIQTDATVHTPHAPNPANLLCQIQGVAPGIGLPDELRELKYKRPSEVTMLRFDARTQSHEFVAKILCQEGNQLRASILFERTQLSRQSSGWLHRLLNVRYH